MADIWGSANVAVNPIIGLQGLKQMYDCQFFVQVEIPRSFSRTAGGVVTNLLLCIDEDWSN